MAQLILDSLAATDTLADALAQLLAASPLPCLLRGEMGSGKTTLISQVVRHLPGGTGAEPSSPSFTIANYYPTCPPVLHCDLYRVPGDAPEEIYEFIEEERGILLVEWGERLNPRPADYLDIFLNMLNDKRLVEATGHGPHANSLARRLNAWPALLPCAANFRQLER